MSGLRVGILSMQRIFNYGSFLQAYALRALLEESGCDVQFVDYKPGECLVVSERPGLGMFRKARKGVELLSCDAPLAAKFSFIKHKSDYAKRFYPLLGLSGQLNLAPCLDMLVIGSDEVFNCVQSNINVGFTPALFGFGSTAERTITYAASFGNTTIGKLKQCGKEAEVGGYIGALDAVSVRDANSESIVRELTGIEPACHLDPVLVYDYLGEPGLVPDSVDEEDYLVLYGYPGRFSKGECASVRAYADARGMRVLNIGGVQGCCDRFIDCSPLEVLAYFKNASAVVTDTFHGTIFSIVSHTPFVTFARDEGYGNAEKLIDLSTRLGIANRFARDAEDTASILAAPVDWGAIDKVVASERKSAKAYLSRQITLCGNVV